jgi:putative DNA primase/helicase
MTGHFTEAALAYAREGLRVHPLRPRDKRPLLAAWQQRASCDPKQVEEWWSEHPTANIGIATGAGSGLVVLDIDGPEGDEAWAELSSGREGVATRVVRTGRGRHLWLATDRADLRNTAGKLGFKIDVRGEGGYVVAPPSIHPDGTRYAFEDPEVPIEPLPLWLTELMLRPPRTRAAASSVPVPPTRDDGGSFTVDQQLEYSCALVAAAEEGTRNDTLNREAFRLGRLVGAGRLVEEVVLERLHEAGLASGLEEQEVDQTVSGALERGKAAPELLMRTDYGNAERLVAQHGEDLRYVADRGTWVVWDETRWAGDVDGEVMRRAKAMVRSIREEAAGVEEEKTRNALLSFAAKSEQHPRLEAAIKLAETELEVVSTTAQFDTGSMLLNCANGTVDLTTGELRPHDRHDLLTRISPVSYDPDAASSRWEDYLGDVTGGDTDMAEFLQRCAGYTITGRTDEEVLFFLHGPGATGKSSFVDALRNAFGSGMNGYCTTADFDTFLRKPYGGGTRNDLARLQGARAVFSSEVEDGKELAEGVVKAVTGGDTITARFLYREHFEFVPEFALWLVANHRPLVSAEDDALWRRIKVLPFTNIIPPARRDPSLKAFLRDPKRAGPAILAWAIQGCLAWQQHGLGEPPSVVQATAAYRGDMDSFHGFFDHVVVSDPAAWTEASAIHDRLRVWLLQYEDEEPQLQKKKIAARLKALGGKRLRRNGAHGWLDISLQP